MAARSVLAAIYDGPIDTNSYSYQAVILQRIPSIKNGDAQLFTKSFYIGDEVVDANGTPVTLAVGVKIRPAGCREDACAIVYDGTSEVQMDQMQVTFSMLPGLTWSDGKPLTSEIQCMPTRWLPTRPPQVPSTSWTAPNHMKQWMNPLFNGGGNPVSSTPLTSSNFWSPLPEHAWSQIAADQLTETDLSTRTPLGWGAYAS